MEDARMKYTESAVGTLQGLGGTTGVGKKCQEDYAEEAVFWLRIKFHCPKGGRANEQHIERQKT